MGEITILTSFISMWKHDERHRRHLQLYKGEEKKLSLKKSLVQSFGKEDRKENDLGPRQSFF